MLVHRFSRQCPSTVARPFARVCRQSTRRGISSSLPAHAPRRTEGERDEEDIEFGAEASVGGGGPKTYREFLDTIGAKFQYAQPSNWLSEDAPFPMNPSFRPPPPISDAQRLAIYDLYVQDPVQYSVRRLAKRFNLSLKRVDAILRLKGMEVSWNKRGIPLQTGYQAGMDKLLNSQTHASIPDAVLKVKETEARLAGRRYNADNIDDPAFVQPGVHSERLDAHLADALEQEENRDASKYRYERLYWESVVDDGREPVLPTILQYAKQKAEYKKLQRELSISANTGSVSSKSLKSRVVRRPRKSRPSTNFIDVGARFVDVNERLERLAVSGRMPK